MCPPGGGGHANAPPPLLVTNSTNPIRVNTGYDPKDTQNPNVDRPLFFAEDQDVAGIDRHPVNPIPSGKPGQGNWFAVEPGAADYDEASRSASSRSATSPAVGGSASLNTPSRS